MKMAMKLENKRKNVLKGNKQGEEKV